MIEEPELSAHIKQEFARRIQANWTLDHQYKRYKDLYEKLNQGQPFAVWVTAEDHNQIAANGLFIRYSLCGFGPHYRQEDHSADYPIELNLNN